MDSKALSVPLAILTLMLFLANNSTTSAQNIKTNSALKDLKWLSGQWERTNNKPGRNGHERWLMKSANELDGVGVTMKGSDTLFIEKLKIIAVDSGIYYVADVAENKKPVPFKLTSATSSAFVFENSLHDFPKRIEYLRESEKLHVVVSGNGKAIDYFFSKR